VPVAECGPAADPSTPLPTIRRTWYGLFPKGDNSAGAFARSDSDVRRHWKGDAILVDLDRGGAEW
jgi:hypothetical protein